MSRDARIRVVAVSDLHRLRRWAVPVLALGFVGATAIIIGLTTPWATSYAGASPTSLAADLAAGLAMIVVGSAIVLQRRERDRGALAIVAGIAWLAADWIGWQGGPPLLRSLAAVVAPFFLPVLFDLAWRVSLHAHRRRPARRPTVVLLGYGAVAVVTTAQALFRDPRLDRFCWNNCTDNVFLIGSSPWITAALHWLDSALALGLGLALVIVALNGLGRATPTGRRVLWVVLVPASLVGLSAALHAGAIMLMPPEGPQIPLYVALFQLRAWTAAAVALGLGVMLLRAYTARQSVRRLAADLGDAPRPGALAAVLARATNDPNLEVAYLAPDRSRLIDAQGQTIEQPPPDARRATTPIMRDGVPIAAIIHDDVAVTAEHLERVIGAAARLAIDNERLKAQTLAELTYLRTSRARIVEAGDSERQRLERNLHDGAQQRLLALTYDLRMARAAADGAGDRGLAERLESALSTAQSAIDELRDLAHGIYPAVLTGAGLSGALSALAESARIAVEVIECPAERFADPVERAAYAVVAGAVEEAASRGTGHVEVRVFTQDEWMIVHIAGVPSDSFPHLADRVGALGGWLATDAESLRAGIPCA